ncbi:hypothetical protein SDC9_199511 [bioreactor metagenome]|uniref:Uncharacterized protein n=1 Tax=bioreactor metagenome TaxID=1076179 RepID=A0A645IKQ4_9ZZZZ
MIRVTTVMPAMAQSPKAPADTFRTAEATLPSPCRQKEGRPPLRISAYCERLTLTLRSLGTMLPPLVVAANRIGKLANWLMAVASAAPDTPMFSVKMNRGSSPTLSRAPKPMPIIAKKALPCSRSWLLSTREAISQGAPSRI